MSTRVRLVLTDWGTYIFSPFAMKDEIKSLPECSWSTTYRAWWVPDGNYYLSQVKQRLAEIGAVAHVEDRREEGWA